VAYASSKAGLIAWILHERDDRVADLHRYGQWRHRGLLFRLGPDSVVPTTTAASAATQPIATSGRT
jgi:hypothetical protein